MFGFRKKPVITGAAVYGVVPQSPLPLPSLGRVKVAFSAAPQSEGLCVKFWVRLPQGTNVAAILASANAANDPQVIAIGATPGENGRSVMIALSGPVIDNVIEVVAESLQPEALASKAPGVANYYELLTEHLGELKKRVLIVVDV